MDYIVDSCFSSQQSKVEEPLSIQQEMLKPISDEDTPVYSFT